MSARVVGLLEAAATNSRFGKFNSRFGRGKFPFSVPREIVRKSLVCFTFLGPERGCGANNPGSSRRTGNSAGAVHPGLSEPAPFRGSGPVLLAADKVDKDRRQ